MWLFVVLLQGEVDIIEGVNNVGANQATCIRALVRSNPTASNQRSLLYSLPRRMHDVGPAADWVEKLLNDSDNEFINIDIL